MEDDTELIKRLQSKDEIALGLVYDKYAGALFGVIIRICKDQNLAENILQDVFIKIWDKSHNYDPLKGRFYTWCYRIARNTSLNAIRKQSKVIQMDDLSVYKEEGNAINDDFDILALQGSIKKLELHHQKAIELIYYNGLTHREAHEEMQVPLGTFKSYIKQALKQLKEMYGTELLLLIFIEFMKMSIDG